MNLSFSYVGSSLFLLIAVLGTTMIASSSITQVWADVIEGTEGFDEIVGTPGDDVIDSKGGRDGNTGDVSFSSIAGDASGDDVIASGEQDDTNTGNGGADVFVCGEGEEDTVTDFNEEEGDIATPDCENV